MNLIGHMVRILVNEPWEWEERDLTGTIISQKDECTLIVKLPKEISGQKLTSDLLELSPRYEGVTFNSLTKSSSVTAGGALVLKDNDDFDYIIIATVTLQY